MPASRQLSQESLASVRQKRLSRRIERQAPLLAEQLIADELAAKPDYYAGQTDPAIAAVSAALGVPIPAHSPRPAPGAP